MNRRKFMFACAAGASTATALRLAIDRPAKCDHRNFDIVTMCCRSCRATKKKIICDR